MTGTVVVLDIGKTLTKLSCWSADGTLLAKVVRPNQRVQASGLARLDVDGIGAFVIESLAEFGKSRDIAAIIPVAHGAAVAGIRGDTLAFGPLDYEQPIPPEIMADYDAQRDPCAHTGSPCLPAGLNFGRQLHWLQDRDPLALDGVTLLPWAQFWSWWLSGVATTEITSLGSHSDLWAPAAGGFSEFAKVRGWASKFAPIVKAGDRIGTLRPELAGATGLSARVAIHCGLHDSNAALLASRAAAKLNRCEATILSTGTWFIAMRMPSTPVVSLPFDRDCLINVDIHGNAVPTARFMGGREIELLGGSGAAGIDTEADQIAMMEAVAAVVRQGAMLLPGFVAGSGPFPSLTGRWINRPDDEIQRRAAIALYAALVTNTALDLIGAQKRLLIEGRFARATVFTSALASLRPAMAVDVCTDITDVAFGALGLIAPIQPPDNATARVQPLATDLATYRARWLAAIVDTVQ